MLYMRWSKKVTKCDASGISQCFQLQMLFDWLKYDHADKESLQFGKQFARSWRTVNMYNKNSISICACCGANSYWTGQINTEECLGFLHCKVLVWWEACAQGINKLEIKWNTFFHNSHHSCQIWHNPFLPAVH